MTHDIDVFADFHKVDTPADIPNPERGITFVKSANKWRVRVYYNGKVKEVGYFRRYAYAVQQKRLAEKAIARELSLPPLPSTRSRAYNPLG